MLCCLAGGLVIVFVIYLFIQVGVSKDSGFFGKIEPWEERKPRFQKAAKCGKPLIDAIKSYHRDRGIPPNTLQDLIPDFLSQISKTVLSDYPNYKYTRFQDDGDTVAWYDLENHEQDIIKGQWVFFLSEPVYITNKQNGAVFALLLDTHGMVKKFCLDRMPENYSPMKFDIEGWKEKRNRVEMIHSLMNDIDFIGMNIDELLHTLGEQDGRISALRTPWELRIDCGQGFGNWDTFIYWPTENYPPFSYYSGWLEPIENLAYVHE